MKKSTDYSWQSSGEPHTNPVQFTDSKERTQLMNSFDKMDELSAKLERAFVVQRMGFGDETEEVRRSLILQRKEVYTFFRNLLKKAKFE